MKKSNLFFLLLVFFISGCGKENASQLLSGQVLSDSLNQDAAVTLNYRINQEAINAHSSLLFYKQLEKWNGANVPDSYGITSIPELRSLFSYLHKKDNSLGIESLKVISERGGHLLVFQSKNRTLQLWSDRSVSKIIFDNGFNTAVEMVQMAPQKWEIKNIFGTFIWNVEEEKICYLDECISL